MTKKLLQTTQLVKTILEKDEKARNSDNYLYYCILSKLANEKGIDINTISIPEFLLDMSDLGFPPFETVRRTRQKAQEKHPELCASESVQIARAELEQDFRAFARCTV